MTRDEKFTQTFEFIHEMLNYTPSALYNLPPIGLGTPYVECLTSYIKRLVMAHNTILHYFVKFIGRLMVTNDKPYQVTQLKAIDGATDNSENWYKWLSELTTNKFIFYTTMLVWQHCLSIERSLRKYLAWCPLCYQEARNRNVPIYDPLLNRIADVHVCLKHMCLLRTSCPYCSHQIPVIGLSTYLGYCSKCFRWLGEDEGDSNFSPEQIEFAVFAESLIMVGQKIDPPNFETIQNLIQLVKSDLNFTWEQLHAYIGVGSIQYWKIRYKKLGLSNFIRLCIKTNGLPFEILEANYNPTHTSKEEREAVSYDSREKDESVEDYLNRLLNTAPLIPPFAFLCKQCGYSGYQQLKKEFPVLYDALSKRLDLEQEEYLNTVIASGTTESLEKILRRRGYSVSTCSEKFPKQTRTIRHNYQQNRTSTLANIREYLVQIIYNQPTPLPTVEEIAKHFAETHNFIQQNFAVEISEIEVIRRNRRNFELSDLAKKLEVIAKTEQGIPPSLSQLASEFGEDINTLRSANPQAYNAIKIKAEEYERQKVEKKCEKIRSEVADAHKNGIIPQLKKIEATIGEWVSKSSIYYAVYIETMREYGYDVQA